VTMTLTKIIGSVVIVFTRKYFGLGKLSFLGDESILVQIDKYWHHGCEVVYFLLIPLLCICMLSLVFYSGVLALLAMLRMRSMVEFLLQVRPASSACIWDALK
jgi:hypothetical protein